MPILIGNWGSYHSNTLFFGRPNLQYKPFKINIQFHIQVLFFSLKLQYLYFLRSI